MNVKAGAPSVADPHSALSVVEVIIVSYKTSTLVTKLLNSLALERIAAAKHGIAIRALVVDNASGDAQTLNRTVVESGWLDWVEIAESPRNGGFAYGNNLGFRHGFASARVPDYFFLLNPDTEVRLGAVSSLVGFIAQHRRAGIAASSLEGRDGTLWPFAFRFPSLCSELDQGLRVGVVTW